MNIETLKNLIEQGESRTLEFKKSLASLDSAGKALCGFLNQSEGGTALIGVQDHGNKLTGQEVTDSVLKKIAAFLNRLQPSGRIDIEYIELNTTNKKIIMFKAHPLVHERPYSYDGKYYERIESTTQQLSHEHVKCLFLESSDATKIWGERTSSRYNQNDLDFDEIKKVIRRAVDVNRVSSEALGENIEDLMHRFKLMVNNKLTHSAIVLFAKDTEKFFPQCKIHMARFKGTDKYGEFLDNQLIWGNAFQILQTSEDFIRKHLFIASHFQDNSFERIDEPTLPVKAVREALINAICHRNYRDRGTSITLAIYDDHLEIWNSGTLPSGWTLNKLKQKHNSEPRNELIAKIFYMQKFIESWGTGIKKILDECEKANLPEPKFSEYSKGVAITFKYKEPLVKHSADKKNSQINNRQEEILNLLKETPLAMREISDKTTNQVVDRTLRRDMSHLKELGLVKGTGHGRNYTWELTRKGDKHLKELEGNPDNPDNPDIIRT